MPTPPVEALPDDILSIVGGEDEAVGNGYQTEFGCAHGWDDVRRLIISLTYCTLPFPPPIPRMVCPLRTLLYFIRCAMHVSCTLRGPYCVLIQF